MDPLSPWTYGRRNVRKVLPALIILTFVVLLVFVILSTLGGLRESMLVYTREFGVDVDEEDWMLGRFKVVGILEGPVPVGVCSFEFLNNPIQYAFSAKLWEREIVVAKPGRISELNAFLRTLKDVKVYDKTRAVEDVTQGFDRIILVFRFISILLIIVVSFVVGLINNIFFAQRVDEFAVLMAIGHPQRRVFRMVSGETAGLMALSWSLGIALGTAVFAGFRAIVMEPRGIPLPMWQPGPLLISLVLPLVAQAFAVVTVLGRLRRLDPVTIIERRG